MTQQATGAMMGRQHNQDYYKVAGSNIEEREQAAGSRKKYSAQAAATRHAAQRPAAPPKAKPQKAPAAKASREASSPPIVAPRPAAQKSPLSATVLAIHSDKPRHGKKRRSTKKRHEVEVIHEMRAHPQESPQEAAEAVRHSDPLSARMRDVADKRSATLPSSSPQAQPERGIMARAMSAYDMGKQALSFAGDLVAAPFRLVRLVRALSKQGT